MFPRRRLGPENKTTRAAAITPGENSRFLTGPSARFGMTSFHQAPEVPSQGQNQSQRRQTGVSVPHDPCHISRPFGAELAFDFLTHGLRRGLHSFAALRLGFVYGNWSPGLVNRQELHDWAMWLQAKGK